MIRITRFNWQETTAYFFSAIAVGLGVYLGIKREPNWLSMAGSMIIICGVLLASSRKIDLLQSKVEQMISEHRTSEFGSIISEHQHPDGTGITAEQSAEICKRIYSELAKETAEIIGKRRRIFKLHEILLVTAGTFINGFGPWLIKIGLHHST